MRILLISDIHANFPALEAIAERFPPESFDLILNGGDTLVYGPFPNQTIDWLRKHHVLSILGNTDRYIIDLLRRKTFAKPADPDEFLFADTPICRFKELAELTSTSLVTVGHSHSQFHVRAGNRHFINPGSVGRMFDGRISGGCAVIRIKKNEYDIELHRIIYSARMTAEEINRLRLPSIYAEMYLRGRKLN